jgi:hypothetical protein
VYEPILAITPLTIDICLQKVAADPKTTAMPPASRSQRQQPLMANTKAPTMTNMHAKATAIPK